MNTYAREDNALPEFYILYMYVELIIAQTILLHTVEYVSINTFVARELLDTIQLFACVPQCSHTPEPEKSVSSHP